MNALEVLTDKIEKLRSKHTFCFTDDFTSKPLKMEKSGKHGSRNCWDYEYIINTFGSIKGLLQHFKNVENVSTLYVSFKKKHGNRSIPTDIPDVKLILKPKDVSNQNAMSNPDNNSYNQHNQTVQPIQPIQPLGQPAQINSGQVGLGMAEFMDYRDSKTKLFYETELRKKLERELEKERARNEKLTIDLRDADSKCKLADDKLAFEIQKATESKKSFFDTPAFQEILKNTPTLVNAFIGNGNQQAAQPLAGAQQQETLELTPQQEALINAIIEKNVTNDKANFYYELINNIEAKEDFYNQIKLQLEQQKTS